ncbi:unnamed protein product [Coregonus sp. 'balchen']|nr:unnamed protein product [Coregonus sp. 'balchen']
MTEKRENMLNFKQKGEDTRRDERGGKERRREERRREERRSRGEEDKKKGEDRREKRGKNEEKRRRGGLSCAPQGILLFSVLSGGMEWEDINECKMGRNTCANDTVCFNLEGGYDCRCPHGRNCTGDCIHDNKVKHNRQIWVLDNDRCSVCSCQTGQVMCRRMVCDCENPTADLFCCPECDPRLSSQCLHQNGLLTYGSGDSWVENCQQCQCLQGQVDCWPLSCPPVDCEFTVVPEGECCARCIIDPCQADTIRNDITKTCTDEHGIQRFSGSSWIKHGTEMDISVAQWTPCAFSS